MLSKWNPANRKLRLISKGIGADGYENMSKQLLEIILTKPSSSIMVVTLNTKVRRMKNHQL